MGLPLAILFMAASARTKPLPPVKLKAFPNVENLPAPRNDDNKPK